MIQNPLSGKDGGFFFDTIGSMSVLLSQADYVHSPAGFLTARGIIAVKIRNCEYLLTRYAARRRRSGGVTEAAALRNAQNALSRLSAEASAVPASLGQQRLLLK